MGADAAQFASVNDHTASAPDEDLLGGGGSFEGEQAGGEEITEFESSFPSVDTQNIVSSATDILNPNMLIHFYSKSVRAVQLLGLMRLSSLPNHPTEVILNQKRNQNPFGKIISTCPLGSGISEQDMQAVERAP